MKPAVVDLKQIALIVGIVLIAFVISYILRNAISRYSRYSSEKLNVNPTNYRFLKTASSFIIFVLALIIIFHLLPGLEKIGATLLASAGILSIIIGLAAQQTFGNIISGIFIFIYKPFRVGEYVELNNGKNGIVEDINLRFTIIRNGENRRMIIPNTLISNEVIINSNPSGDKVCSFINVHLDYDADIEKAIAEIQKIVIAHPDFLDNRSTDMIEKGMPAVIVQLTSLDNFFMNLCIQAWSRSDAASYNMKCDLLLSIRKRFEEIGISMASQTRKITILHT
jgi:small-conductance mechanosensitive channel